MYNKKQKEFQVTNAIIGLQPVKNTYDKCLLWFKQIVDRNDKVKYTNPRYPIKPTWSKQVWDLKELFTHFEKQLKKVNITKENIHILYTDECTKWRTDNGTTRNFLKAIIHNPKSEISNKPLNIQIVKYIGTTPRQAIIRAKLEATMPEEFDLLLNEYRYKMQVMTYNQYKGLEPVYGFLNGKKVLLFEEKQQIFGTPIHQLDTVKYIENTELNLNKYHSKPEASCTMQATLPRSHNLNNHTKIK